MWWTNHAVGPWWPVAWLGTILFWVLVIWAVVALIRRGTRGGRGPYGPVPPAGRRETPEEILAERFARGEIDDREYRHRLDVLRSGGPSGQQSGRPSGRDGRT